MSLTAKACAYCCNPNPRSQTATSMDEECIGLQLGSGQRTGQYTTARANKLARIPQRRERQRDREFVDRSRLSDAMKKMPADRSRRASNAAERSPPRATHTAACAAIVARHKHIRQHRNAQRRRYATPQLRQDPAAATAPVDEHTAEVGKDGSPVRLLHRGGRIKAAPHANSPYSEPVQSQNSEKLTELLTFGSSTLHAGEDASARAEPSTPGRLRRAMTAFLFFSITTVPRQCCGWSCVFRGVAARISRPPAKADLRTITDNIPAMVASSIATALPSFVNRNYGAGRLKPEDMLGRTAMEVYGDERYAALQPTWSARVGPTFAVDHHIASHTSGRGRWIQHMYMPKVESDGQVSGVYILSNDITDIVDAKGRAMFHREHDELTTLPNRTSFHAAVGRALASRRRDDQLFAVIFVDVDRFKVINDTLGHAAGDHLLQALAVRMKQVVRGRDLVARMGGDEMCCSCTMCATHRMRARSAERILASLRDRSRCATAARITSPSRPAWRSYRATDRC